MASGPRIGSQFTRNEGKLPRSSSMMAIESGGWPTPAMNIGTVEAALHDQSPLKAANQRTKSPTAPLAPLGDMSTISDTASHNPRNLRTFKRSSSLKVPKRRAVRPTATAAEVAPGTQTLLQAPLHDGQLPRSTTVATLEYHPETLKEKLQRKLGRLCCFSSAAKKMEFEILRHDTGRKRERLSKKVERQPKVESIKSKADSGWYHAR